MYIGNGMLLLLNLPLIGIWVKVLKVPSWILFPLIFLFCIIGVYSVNNSIFDLMLMVIFGIVGYVLRKFKYEEAPLVLAFILGPMLETALRQSLIISNGQLSIFYTRPISLGALVLTIVLLISSGVGFFRKARGKVAQVLEKE
jgi:putative tricarboxylic transport membrane protein